MGQTVSQLTQYDIEELQFACSNAFTQAEISSLYARFCKLDRNQKGFLSADDLLKLPELALTNLSTRISRVFENCNFKEFLCLLAPLSQRSTASDRLKFFFEVYDVDGDGRVCARDLYIILHEMTGDNLTVGQTERIIEAALADAGVGADGSLGLDDFARIFDGHDLGLEPLRPPPLY